MQRDKDFPQPTAHTPDVAQHMACFPFKALLAHILLAVHLVPHSVVVYQPVSSQPVPVHGAFLLYIQNFVLLLAELPNISAGSAQASPVLSEVVQTSMTIPFSNSVLSSI